MQFGIRLALDAHKLRSRLRTRRSFDSKPLTLSGNPIRSDSCCSSESETPRRPGQARGRQCAGQCDVLVRYIRAGPFQRTGRLKRRTLHVIRLEQCFYCGRALPAKEKRCVTRPGVTPRRVACYSVRSECPRSFAIGDARYTKDTHDSRLIITLASNVVIDAVPVVFTFP